ncbi:unnamed protein product [Linum trigynum]|uniref:Uncharacterized protein n=1 Tax=Linum trigynum TaxID=586398 RepID=A0AAV2D7J9_9ROSI
MTRERERGRERGRDLPRPSTCRTKGAVVGAGNERRGRGRGANASIRMKVDLGDTRGPAARRAQLGRGTRGSPAWRDEGIASVARRGERRRGERLLCWGCSLLCWARRRRRIGNGGCS